MIFNQIDSETENISIHSSNIFINFSNHPSDKWSVEQVLAAKKLCNNGDIIDVAFPMVSAFASEEDIKNTARMYSEKIIGFNPVAVMCMGEFGLCFKVVEILKEKGIKTVYSCTERKAIEQQTENGVEKTSVFNFVKFREYK